MSLAAARRPSLVGDSLTLLVGGALAQAGPLLLWPLVARLYSPEQLGDYHLFAAVAANLAVVACARYEFALPLEPDDGEAMALRALCRWLLVGATAMTLVGSVVWACVAGKTWPLWLPVSVFVLGALSLATLDATREQRFRDIATGRVVQYTGSAAAQVAAGAAHTGLAGLIAAPLLAGAIAWVALRGRWRDGWRLPWRALRVTAQAHRQFPLLNTPHAFASALQDTAVVALIVLSQGSAAAGFWGLTLRYVKAPATLVGSAVSQALYPRLARSAGRPTPASRAATVRVMATLALMALPIVVLLVAFGPWAFERVFGARWREAGELARSLAVYIGLHFIASPLAVVTMAWKAQAWALRLALVGHVIFIGGVAVGLALGGLSGAGWAVSIAMVPYFGWYFWKLCTWPIER